MSSGLVYEKAADFKHILRILNTNVEGKRKVPFALRGIKGIGRRFAFVICRKAKIDPSRRAGDLSEQEMTTVTNIIDDPVGNGIPKWFLNRQKDFKTGKWQQLASNYLETALREDLERLKKIRSHRGIRHHWGLRVRGQHTKSTGRRGATVGVVKKKK